MACVFCEIAQGRVPAPVVFEDHASLAFLDHRPLFAGHVLLIPRDHVETLAELPRTRNGDFLGNVQVLCRALEAGLGAEGTFVAVNNRVSQSVPHLHVHIVPRHRGDGLKGFFWPRRKYANEQELSEVQQKVRQAATLISEEEVKRKT
ncbi:MAG TPA: HIT family protein [Bryobacteraceae bacterium]|nr:HIT family protein [Bryobacteraceae bacterium]